VSTINAKKHVDGGPQEVPELEVQKLKTSMEGPLGVLAAKPAAATTEVEDVDGGAPGGAGDRANSDHHQSWRRQWRAHWGVLPA
jgi:hypothetical protein